MQVMFSYVSLSTHSTTPSLPSPIQESTRRYRHGCVFLLCCPAPFFPLAYEGCRTSFRVAHIFLAVASQPARLQTKILTLSYSPYSFEARKNTALGTTTPPCVGRSAQNQTRRVHTHRKCSNRIYITAVGSKTRRRANVRWRNKFASTPAEWVPGTKREQENETRWQDNTTVHHFGWQRYFDVLRPQESFGRRPRPATRQQLGHMHYRRIL